MIRRDEELGSLDERALALEQLGSSWQRTLENLEEGEISEPAEAELLTGDRAYHIVRLDRFVPEHRVDLETDYERIRQLALNQKQSRELTRWMERLREDVYVDIRVDGTQVATQGF